MSARWKRAAGVAVNAGRMGNEGWLAATEAFTQPSLGVGYNSLAFPA